MFLAESVRDAAFGCDWVGTAIPFQRCLMFINATANKEFRLTAGKFVPVSNVTTMDVCMYLCINVCMYMCICLFVYMNYLCTKVRMKNVIKSKIYIIVKEDFMYERINIP